jgi:glycosyltransferase involved in cell wall biosynthesis
MKKSQELPKKVSEDLKELTVLVTFYNKGIFLRNLTENLSEILYLGARVIFLDDGSDLMNRELIEKHVMNLSSMWPNTFQLISQENQGSAASRNLLIQKTQTSYFMFLDADDLIISQNLIFNMTLLKQSNADFLIGDWVDMDGESSHVQLSLVKNSNIFIELNGNAELMKLMGYWRIIYRTEYIKLKKFRFVPTKQDLEGRHFILDDVFWMIQIACSSGKCVVMEQGFPIYRYFTTDFNPVSREIYRMQEMLMAIATKYYLKFREKDANLSQAEKRLLFENLICNFLDLTPYSMKKSFLVFAGAIFRVGGVKFFIGSVLSIRRILIGMFRKWYDSKKTK